ncbi:Uncharacterised protein [Nocardia brasiliensis]|nr:Uncharacterised protein [Nocardia brasiliensis]
MSIQSDKVVLGMLDEFLALEDFLGPDPKFGF